MLSGLAQGQQEYYERQVAQGRDDLTFSAPKSVSVLFAAADEQTRELIEAYQAAVAGALSYIEDEAVKLRRGARRRARGDVRRAFSQRRAEILASEAEAVHKAREVRGPPYIDHVHLSDDRAHRNLGRGARGAPDRSTPHGHNHRGIWGRRRRIAAAKSRIGVSTVERLVVAVGEPRQ